MSLPTIPRTADAILEHLETLDSDTLVSINNQYANEHDSDALIDTNDEDFFTTFFSSPMEAVRAVAYGDYHYSHPYVYFNWYGNLETLWNVSLDDIRVDLPALIEYIIENPDDYTDYLDIEFSDAE